MGDLREIKPAERPWHKPVGDDDGADEPGLRAELDKALKDGERISIIWALQRTDGTTEFSYTHGRRQGTRMNWAEFLGVLQAVVTKYFRDIFNA